MRDPDHARPKFPEPLVGWLDQHGALISALVMLRRGQEDEAVDALLQTRELQTLRLSWELWAGLLSTLDSTAEEILCERLPTVLVEHCAFALWGRPLPDDGTPRLAVRMDM